MSDTQENKNKYSETIASIKEGLDQLLQSIQEYSESHPVLEDLRQSLPLIDQLDGWAVGLPPERFHTTLLSLIGSLDNIIIKAVKAGDLPPSVYGASDDFPSAPFIVESVTQIGPEITVSRDRMQVSLVLPEAFKHVWTPERIKSGLERQGIVFGIDEEAIRSVVQKKPGTAVTVAGGQEPIAGTDAIMEECLGLCEMSGKPTITQTGRADFKQLNAFINVSKGQVVVKKTPPVSGTPGMDVHGESIPCREGEDFPFPPVSNTEVSEDELALISTVDGCAYLEGDRIAIVPALEIKDNVDYSTGNIHASVAVTVNGDVLSGFKVESREDILVKGTVEGSQLSAQRNIFFPGGVQGKEEAQIRAGNNIEAKFINAARVQAKGTITVQGFVMNSYIKAKRLHLEGEGAELIGGIIDAADDIKASRIGSDIGVKTKVRLGYEMEEFKNSIEQVSDEINSWNDKIQRFTESKQTLDNWKEKKGELPPDKQEIYEKLIKNLEKAKKAITEKEKEMEKIQEEMEAANMSVRMIRASETIMPGVEISILNHTFTVKSPTGPAALYIMNDEIGVFPYQERTFEDEEDVE